MPKKTSTRVAKIASKVLKDKRQDKASKTVAASSLAQKESKRKKK